MKRQQLLKQIQTAIEAIGVPYVNTRKILAHLHNEQKVNALPSRRTLRRFLHEDFRLKFRLTKGANVKYNDADFD